MERIYTLPTSNRAVSTAMAVSVTETVSETRTETGKMFDVQVKWFVAFVIAACVLVVVVSCRSDAERGSQPMDFDEIQAADTGRDEPGDQGRESRGRFHDRRWGYLVEFPPDWQLADHSASSDMIRADISRGDVVGVQIRVVSRQGASFEAFVESYVKAFMDDMTGHWQGSIDGVSKSFERIGQHRGCVVRMVLERGDGQAWLLKQYLWPLPDGADEVVVFQGGTMLEDRGVGEYELDRVAASFRLVPDE